MKRLIPLLLAALLLAGCSAGPVSAEKTYFDAFDTVTQITVYAPSAPEAEALIDGAHDELLEYHRLFDIYNTYEGMNNIASINAAAGVAPVEADERIIDLLLFSIEAYELTGGKVNVAMGSVLRLWHDAREAGTYVPDAAALAAAAEHTDISCVIIDEAAGTVYLSDPDMSLDVGATAKGFAAARITAGLTELGASSALVSAGGNVCASGSKPSGAWRVGVQDPFGSGSVCVLGLTDMCAVTSGAYQRYFEVDGVRYSHIIDPDTLMPAAYCEAVTVLCRDSAMADALSTALFNMPVGDGLALVSSLADTEALWIGADGGITYSAGFEAYLVG